MFFDERYINNRTNFKILKPYFKFYFVVSDSNVFTGSDVFPSKILMNITCQK